MSSTTIHFNVGVERSAECSRLNPLCRRARIAYSSRIAGGGITEYAMTYFGQEMNLQGFTEGSDITRAGDSDSNLRGPLTSALCARIPGQHEVQQHGVEV